MRLQQAGRATLIIAIADGAGSAKLSHVGSREAVARILSTARASELSPKDLSKTDFIAWIEDVVRHLDSVALRESVSLPDLACTLLVAIIGPAAAAFCQIGDGAWVIETDGQVRNITWPCGGEYANETTFVTSGSALKAMQFERIDGRVNSVAGFSDGIQALGLNFASRTVHAPFFEPLFSSIRRAEDDASLIVPLREFLGSQSVTERTDDDKTLVLAYWKEPVNDSNGVGK